MKAIKFIGYSVDMGAPSNWDVDTDPPIYSLPVMITEQNYGDNPLPAQHKTYTSVWKLTWRERLRILLGYKVALTLLDFQVPVHVEVSNASELPS